MTKNVTAQVYPTAEQAVAEGYAEFNRNPHLAVDIPDGGFTITAKTSEGKRITFAFQPYRTGGPPKCVDIAYHDGDQELTCNRELRPVFDVLLFGSAPAAEKGRLGRQFEHDTRKADWKPGIACVLLYRNEEEK